MFVFFCTLVMIEGLTRNTLLQRLFTDRHREEIHGDEYNSKRSFARRCHSSLGTEERFVLAQRRTADRGIRFKYIVTECCGYPPSLAKHERHRRIVSQGQFKQRFFFRQSSFF